MRRGPRLLVAVTVVGMWLAMGAPAHAATTAPASAPAKATAPAPVVKDPNQPSRTSTWWKNLPRASSVKPRAIPAPSITIGVDNNTPPGHNWEYTAFFPEANVDVHQGDVVDFHFSAGSPAGLHTVSFVPGANDPASVATFRGLPANQAFVPDPDLEKGAHDVLQNNDVFLPQPPPAPVPCGFAQFAATMGIVSPPCPFDNSSFVSSGALPTGGVPGVPSDFQVRLNVAPGTYTYICLIHPKMSGQLTVVGTAAAVTSQAAADAAGAVQYDALNAGAFPVEAAAQHPAAPLVNANGSKTWTEHLGAEADDVQILEMLPSALPIAKGDSVTFTNTTTQEIHTASFPLGPSGFALSPFEGAFCEGVPDTTPDTPAPNPNGIPPNGCPSYAAYEAPFNPAPQGEPAIISSGSTAASSGVLGGGPPPNTPVKYTYTFPKNGKFTFFCQIHFGMQGVISTQGYRTGAGDGGVFNFGAGSDFFGSLGGQHLNKPIVGITGSFDEQGYYETGSDGGVFSFGDAAFFGSMGATHLNKPIVGMASTPDGGGYWLVASDGGIFSFGDATFFGSMGATHLNKPIVGMASTPGLTSGQGYWLVASDGGIFSFGDATFFGSMGAKPLNKPIVGIQSTVGGDGYRLVGSDGGIFDFGSAAFFGSTGNLSLVSPMLGVEGT